MMSIKLEENSNLSSNKSSIRVDLKRVGNESTNSPIVFTFSRTGTSSTKDHLILALLTVNNWQPT